MGRIHGITSGDWCVNDKYTQVFCSSGHSWAVSPHVCRWRRKGWWCPWFVFVTFNHLIHYPLVDTLLYKQTEHFTETLQQFLLNVCACIACGCVHMRVWRTQVCFGCLPLLLAILFFETGSLIKASSHCRDFPGWPLRAQESPVCNPQHWQQRVATTMLLLKFVQWMCFGSSCFYSKHVTTEPFSQCLLLTELLILLSPPFMF